MESYTIMEWVEKSANNRKNTNFQKLLENLICDLGTISETAQAWKETCEDISNELEENQKFVEKITEEYLDDLTYAYNDLNQSVLEDVSDVLSNICQSIEELKEEQQLENKQTETQKQTKGKGR